MLRTITFIFLAILVSCGARQEAESKSSAAPEQEKDLRSSAIESESGREEPAPEVLSSLAAKAVMFDSLHRFVKTANLEFRSKDVVKTVLAIEKLTGETGGFVESSDVRTEENETHIVPIDDYSSKEIRKFTTISSVTLRVPSDKLNEFLLCLQPFVEYLGHRNVTATNIAFDQYLKKMIRQRISAHSLRVLSGKPEASDLDQLLNRELQSDREQVEDMKLDEQVKFSTVHLQISGPDQLAAIRVPAIAIEEYKPSFGNRFAESISAGWNMIVAIFIYIISIWPLVPVIVLILLYIKRRRKVTGNNRKL